MVKKNVQAWLRGQEMLKMALLCKAKTNETTLSCNDGSSWVFFIRVFLTVLSWSGFSWLFKPYLHASKNQDTVQKGDQSGEESSKHLQRTYRGWRMEGESKLLARRRRRRRNRSQSITSLFRCMPSFMDKQRSFSPWLVFCCSSCLGRVYVSQWHHPCPVSSRVEAHRFLAAKRSLVETEDSFRQWILLDFPATLLVCILFHCELSSFFFFALQHFGRRRRFTFPSSSSSPFFVIPFFRTQSFFLFSLDLTLVFWFVFLLACLLLCDSFLSPPTVTPTAKTSFIVLFSTSSCP